MGTSVRAHKKSPGYRNAHFVFRLQVNNLSSSLLAILLLPRLLETAAREHTAPRIVMVTSEMHYWTELEDQVFNSPNAFDLLGSKEYCTPKSVRARKVPCSAANNLAGF